MTNTTNRCISKADIGEFLLGKHLTSCPACRRFRSKCNIDVHALSYDVAQTADAPKSGPLNAIAIVCQNCGAIELHDRTIIEQSLACHSTLRVR